MVSLCGIMSCPHNVNENPPVFVSESVALNSIVLNVSAQDEDPSFIGEVGGVRARARVCVCACMRACVPA